MYTFLWHFVQAVKKAEQEALTQSTLELRQQADFLNTGDTDDLRLTNLNTTAVDDWQQLDPAGNKKKVKVSWLLSSLIVIYFVSTGEYQYWWIDVAI